MQNLKVLILTLNSVHNYLFEKCYYYTCHYSKLANCISYITQFFAEFKTINTKLNVNETRINCDRDNEGLELNVPKTNNKYMQLCT